MPPLNDNFEDAIVLTGSLPLTASGTTYGATAEEQEPYPNSYYQNPSVWYAWTPPTNAAYIVGSSTNLASYSKYLNVFTGTSLEDLVEVGTRIFWDGFPIHNNDSNVVTFQGNPDTTYYFQVWDLYGTSGDFNLLIWQLEPPINDNFEDRIVLTGNLPLTHPGGSNVGATIQEDEPILIFYLEEGNLNSYEGIGASIWYSWTPTSNGFFKMKVEADFDHCVSIYTGITLLDLTLIAQADRNYYKPYETVFFEATSNVTYYIQISGYNGEFGNITSINIDTFNPTLNNNFDDAVLLSGSPAYREGDTNLYANTEPEENTLDGLISATVWYKWIAHRDGEFKLDLSNCDFYAIGVVYSGTTLSELNHITDTRTEYFSSEIITTFTAVKNQTYYFQVGSIDGSAGNIDLSFTRLFELTPNPLWKFVYQNPPLSGENEWASRSFSSIAYANNIWVALGTYSDQAKVFTSVASNVQGPWTTYPLNGLYQYDIDAQKIWYVDGKWVFTVYNGDTTSLKVTQDPNFNSWTSIGLPYPTPNLITDEYDRQYYDSYRIYVKSVVFDGTTWALLDRSGLIFTATDIEGPWSCDTELQRPTVFGASQYYEQPTRDAALAYKDGVWVAVCKIGRYVVTTYEAFVIDRLAIYYATSPTGPWTLDTEIDRLDGGLSIKIFSTHEGFVIVDEDVVHVGEPGAWTVSTPTQSPSGAIYLNGKYYLPKYTTNTSYILESSSIYGPWVSNEIEKYNNQELNVGVANATDIATGANVTVAVGAATSSELSYTGTIWVKDSESWVLLDDNGASWGTLLE